MRNKMYWALCVLIFLIISVFVFVTVKNQAKKRELEREAAAVEQQQQSATEEHPADGHFHDDGTFHADDPPDPIPQEAGAPQRDIPDKPPVKWTAPKGAVLTPVFPKVDEDEDKVKAAYKRLAYIKDNPYAWGGVHAERVTELIDLLMTPSGPVRLIDHNHGDLVSEQIEELTDYNDPRIAEVLIAHMCDGDTVSRSMIDALEEIGPPSVPYILPYLDRYLRQGGTTSIGLFDALGPIGARYRDDLGGIVDYIIIPKLKVIAADEDNERYDSGSVIFARSALSDLEQ